VADDITLAEIGRRLDQLATQVGQLVGRSEHEAHLLLRDQRITEVEKDIAEIHSRLIAAETQRGQVRLALVSAVAGPLLVAVILAVLAGQRLTGG
jgi:hypothetical protein